MASELKPCPFCGSNFKIGQEPHDNDPVAGMFYIFHEYGPIGSAARKCKLDIKCHFNTEKEAEDFWNTRPTPVATVSPDATGKCGELVTVAWFQPSQRCCDNGWMEAMAWQEGEFSAPVVLRSQAVELLAAERAEKEKLEAAWLEAEGIISDLKADNERLRLNADTHQRQFSAANVRAKNMTQKCLGLEAKLAAEIRRERDLAEKQLSEVVDRMSDDYLALKAELDQAVGVIEDRSSEYEALEAKLAAAEKALEPFVSFFNEAMKGFTEGYAERTPSDKPVLGWNNAYLLMQHFIEARATLGGKPS